MTATTSLTILGDSSVSAAEITSWCAANGKATAYVQASMSQMAGWYIEEGQRCNVRGDVAFAEACVETGYFSGAAAAQQLSQNDFAGIGVYSAGSQGSGFPSPQIGVRAHIQLLWKVVNGNGTPPGAPDVSPSWALTGDTITTWGGLSGTWAADPNYGQTIIDVYNTIAGLAAGLGGAGSSSPSGGGGGVATGSAFPTWLDKYTPAVATIPGINPAEVATAALNPTHWHFPYNVKGPSIISQVSTESNIDLTVGQIPQIQLTVIDPDLSIFDSLWPSVGQKEGDIGQLVLWRNEVLTLAEIQSTNVNGVPATILTLRSSVFAWMQTQREVSSLSGSATTWIKSRVALYNSKIPAHYPPATFRGQGTAYRGSNPINTDRPYVQWQSFFDYATTLASQEGFLLFETNGGVFFGEPTWVHRNSSTVSVGWPGIEGPRPYNLDDVDTECLETPAALRSQVLFTGDTMTLQLDRNVGEQIRCGQVIRMNGIPALDNDLGGWIVEEVTFPLDGGATPVQVGCNQAKYLRGSEPGGQTPRSPTSDPTGVQPPGISQPVTASVAKYLTAIFSQKGDAYSQGPQVAGQDFDCSGLVQWGCAQCGITFPRDTYEQWAYLQSVPDAIISVTEAYQTPGALLYAEFGSAGPGHVATSLGDGQNVWQATDYGVPLGIQNVPESAGFFQGGALIPGLNYAPSHSSGHNPNGPGTQA